ncbi:potassium-transporting ATPase subunit C [Micromonospora sp. NPDC048905]|uniref:potassium-transporting ATPase subunit C n=1 Tax=Micromonospora TaxID=1873 RepID=UPI0034046BC4
MRLPNWLAQHLAALRALLVATVVLGLAYPLVMVGIGHIPGLRDRAKGSLIQDGGTTVGSRLIGQQFVDGEGNPLPVYFQSRPSAAGDGYDPTSTAASNLGPENIVDTLATNPDDATPSLLTEVCQRSKDIADLNGVDGRRPFCTPDGVGAVLAVFRRDGLTGPITRVVSVNQACPATPFLARFQDVAVECNTIGEDISQGLITPVRGDAPAEPVIPPDAVTASGSGLDPNISPAYARLQAPRVARERNTDPDSVQRLIDRYTDGRALGFMGEPAVNVLQLNLALDRTFPTNR